MIFVYLNNEENITYIKGNQKIVLEQDPNAKIYLYGSRARGNAAFT